jgi:hypothetical protein
MDDLNEDIICTIPFNGKDYPFNPRDIDVAHLITWGTKYGRDYGAYATFTGLFFQGDARAVSCILSLLLEKQDGVKRPPEAINFSPYDIYKAINEANEEKEQRLRDKLASGEGEDPQPQPSVDETTHDGENQHGSY